MTNSRPTLKDLGALVQLARESKLGGRRKAADYELGPSSAVTWEKVETGQPVQSLTFAGIEDALGWARGSMQAYLNGGPEPAPPPEDEPAPMNGRSTAPSIFEASHDQLLEELRRRHEIMRDELERRLYPALSSVEGAETAESVRARGSIPGLRTDESSEGGDVARGGRQ